MSAPVFGKLVSLSLREAWPDEARDFTPWLAENFDDLSDAVGMQLELTGTEVAVDSFAADILARDVHDDSIVLIENQLEVTDHRHLGQIMTYLAGLDAKTVIWIAPSFRAPHISAIRWLNENTADGFSFFAVKARVVRIGDSPFAPVFEAVEKPDGWQRSLSEKRKAKAGSKSEHSDTRFAFWQHYMDLFPDTRNEGFKETRLWNAYTSLADGNVLISPWIGQKRSGIYVRGGWAERKMSCDELLLPYADELSARLGFVIEPSLDNGHIFGERIDVSYHDPESWDDLINWMEERRIAYRDAIQAVLGAAT